MFPLNRAALIYLVNGIFSTSVFNTVSGSSLTSTAVSNQSQRRDQVIWMYGLRNERPENNDYALGLVSINLTENNISDEFAEEIAKALGYDAYIRHINLSKNNIMEGGCKKLVKSLRKNITVLNLDLRQNPGYTDQIQQRLNLKLIKNIKNIKNTNYTLEEQSYINQFICYDYFNIEIPQNSKN